MDFDDSLPKIGKGSNTRNSQCEHGQPMEQTRGLIIHVQLRCGSLPITTPVSLLANENNDPSVLQGQVSLAVVNQMSFIRL